MNKRLCLQSYEYSQIVFFLNLYIIILKYHILKFILQVAM